MARKTPRHRVFVSFHEKDIKYKERFVRMMSGRIQDRSVDTGSIDDADIKTETIRNKIRDEYIRDATVTVVLIGPCTWQRKHVDWEIGGSLRDTKRNSRCGLIGILLPSHPDFGKRQRNLRACAAAARGQCPRRTIRTFRYTTGQNRGRPLGSPVGYTERSHAGEGQRRIRPGRPLAETGPGVNASRDGSSAALPRL